jgi:hypothetical protein
MRDRRVLGMPELRRKRVRELAPDLAWADIDDIDDVAEDFFIDGIAFNKR